MESHNETAAVELPVAAGLNAVLSNDPDCGLTPDEIDG